MLRKLNKSKGGFTLVEIMIVVAIIALLATIAVPNFLRSRKRAQATAILEEMRLIDGAKDTWGIENNKKGKDTPKWSDLQPYFKPGSRLANQTTEDDLLGNEIEINDIDTPPTVHADTLKEFENVVNEVSFWGSYKAGTATP